MFFEHISVFYFVLIIIMAKKNDNNYCPLELFVASRMLEKGILVVEGSPGISSFATHYFGPGSR